jgi:hypothetical protein
MSFLCSLNQANSAEILGEWCDVKDFDGLDF